VLDNDPARSVPDWVGNAPCQPPPVRRHSSSRPGCRPPSSITQQRLTRADSPGGVVLTSRSWAIQSSRRFIPPGMAQSIERAFDSDRVFHPLGPLRLVADRTHRVASPDGDRARPLTAPTWLRKPVVRGADGPQGTPATTGREGKGKFPVRSHGQPPRRCTPSHETSLLAHGLACTPITKRRFG
jgi:hypothetical protein